MKSYLLDASAFMFLIKKANPQTTIHYVRESMILDLTFYEVGNALWKESALIRTLSSSESETLTENAQTILGNIEKIENETDSFQQILDLAKKEKLTFYDSSYIFFAKEKNLKLVTEDKELYTKGKKYVAVQTTADLMKA
jgi:predicted nucleic acid-binding protein